jgi:acyl dehydratase
MIELDRGNRKQAEQWIERAAPRRACALDISAAHGRLACAMVDDSNPLYWQSLLAHASFGYDVVPPATLMTHSLPLPWSPDGAAAQRPLWAHVPLPGDTIINVSTTTTFLRPLPAGAQLTVSEQVTAISALRATKVGDGYFLTTRSDYHDSDGTLLATNDNTMLRYDAGATQQSTSLEPTSLEPNSPGDEPPLFQLAVDRRRLALNVAATWDLFPGHHDDDYARAQGVPGVYVNTLFLHALVDRAATQLVGAHAGATWSRPVRRQMVMRRPVMVGSVVDVHALLEPTTDSSTPRCRVSVRDEHGTVCVEATVDVATSSTEATA